MFEMREPSTAEIAENRRAMALQMAIHYAVESKTPMTANEMVAMARTFENYVENIPEAVDR